MTESNEFNKIGDGGRITSLKSKRTSCHSCGNVIELDEKFFQVKTAYDMAITVTAAICKNCIRLAAKRLGLMR